MQPSLAQQHSVSPQYPQCLVLACCPQLPPSGLKLRYQPSTAAPHALPAARLPWDPRLHAGWSLSSLPEMLFPPSDFSTAVLCHPQCPEGGRVSPTQVNGQVCFRVSPSPRHPSPQARDPLPCPGAQALSAEAQQAAGARQLGTEAQGPSSLPSRPFPRRRHADTHERKMHLLQPLLSQAPCPRPMSVTQDDTWGT